MTTSPISFTEDGLDELETNLREIQPGFDGCVTGHALALKAADAIAYLRRERVPREPTRKMLQHFVNVWPDGNCTNDDIRKAWRAMYDAAPVGKP